VSYTRRRFLLDVARSGGSVFAAMTSLDLLAQDNGATWLPDDLPRVGRGRKIAIIGAGAAGLSAAYELTRLGFKCSVLEARTRPGGRIWTIRRGVRETEISGREQQCQFDPGHYYNAGPARIPQHHYTTLGYCRKFGVALEVFNNYNESAYIHSDRLRRKVRVREARADYEGHTAELLAKAISANQLDAALTKEDAEKLVEYLRRNAGLSADLKYSANASHGYSEWPAAAGQSGVLTPGDDLTGMIGSGFASYLAHARNITQQAVMLQPVGGIDALPFAMAKQLASMIEYGAEVTALRRVGEHKVRIEYRNTGSAGAAKALEADYCLCTTPASVLKDIPSDLSAPHREALSRISYGASNKIGLQFRRRFWEQDDWIYGGISWTDQQIRQIWYPNYGYFDKKGVVVGYYAGEMPEERGGKNITAMTPAERTEYALASGEKIHPQYRSEFENAFSVSWAAIRFSNGANSRYESTEARRQVLGVIGQPDGPIYFAGEHASWLSGWIAGAFESALRAVRLIHERASM
jgi:monoamine oxidase